MDQATVPQPPVVTAEPSADGAKVETPHERNERWAVRGGAITLQICAASVIAAIGLHVGNIPIVIGSMLLSPIGGACLDIGKKSARNVHTLMARNIELKTVLNVNTALPLFLRMVVFTLVPIGVGVGFGACLSPRYDTTSTETVTDGQSDDTVTVTDDDSEQIDVSSYERPNSEILGRSVLYGDWIKNLLGGLIVAIAAGTMLSIGDVNAVVGIGIATALLPPLVSCGMLLGTSFRVKNRKLKDFLHKHSVGALATFGVNFFAILLVSFILYMLMMASSKLVKKETLKDTFEQIRSETQNAITKWVNMIQKIE